MSRRTFRIGTRASHLALAQTRWFAGSLMDRNPGLVLDIIHITTEGDTSRASALSEMGGEGLFTKRLELALLQEQIDVAVHSAKDLPSVMTEGLTLASVPTRESVEDVLISSDGSTLSKLKPGSVVGTGSPRRRAQVLHLRPDLEVRDIRGNVETRIRKLNDGEYDALIMARAGLKRSDLASHITEVLPPHTFVPAPGQGFLAIQTRSGDAASTTAVEPMDDPAAHRMLEIERRLLATLNAGCSTPIGGFARVDDDRVVLTAVVLDRDGKAVLRAEHSIDIDDNDRDLVSTVADRLLDQGAHKLITADND
jgi:hydroxymethylbilane synthase